MNFSRASVAIVGAHFSRSAPLSSHGIRLHQEMCRWIQRVIRLLAYGAIESVSTGMPELELYCIETR